MKFWVKISLFLIVVWLGNPIRDFISNRIVENAAKTNIGQVQKSMEYFPNISIWGSSTAFMGVNTKTIETTTGKSCYNFGISGAYFNQLNHLYTFALKQKSKTIIWVINPYEFLKNKKPVIDAEQYFSPFLHRTEFVGLEHKSWVYKHLGWYQIFKMNAKHWQLAMGEKTPQEFDDFGNHIYSKKFEDKNSFYDGNKLVFDNTKIELFNQLCENLSEQNELYVVIPPNLKEIDFTTFKSSIEYPIIDFANLISDSTYFHDHIHLNNNGVLILTDRLIKKIQN